ncbi:hypothetical protein K438DRAFT_1987386 [Mycena galopus ATCC 62051]|nr:hypothetical protein K438DRAFT_1987386 [Mycena galopus ATCC 62051]
MTPCTNSTRHGSSGDLRVVTQPTPLDTTPGPAAVPTTSTPPYICVSGRTHARTALPAGASLALRICIPTTDTRRPSQPSHLSGRRTLGHPRPSPLSRTRHGKPRACTPTMHERSRGPHGHIHTRTRTRTHLHSLPSPAKPCAPARRKQKSPSTAAPPRDK